MDVCPLIFEPIFKRKIWGGRRIAELFGRKALPADTPIGESWEVCDLPAEASVVGVGPAKGRTLHQIVEEWGADLVGGAGLVDGRFPLLIKFLDAMENLSVQVHPDREAAKKLGADVKDKNEAWYVLRADGEAAIYAGLKRGVTRESFERALEADQVEALLNRIPVKEGQAYYLPGGTVHALGAGVVVAEVQTSSDTTFRLFDWHRIDETTGRARELHVPQALGCINFDRTAPAAQPRSHVASHWTTVTRLVTCESFTIEKVRMVEGMNLPIPYQEMVIWIVLEGIGAVTYGRCGAIDFFPGDVVVLPAALANGSVNTKQDCVWLEATVPIPSDLAGLARPDREELNPAPDTSVDITVSARPKTKS